MWVCLCGRVHVYALWSACVGVNVPAFVCMCAHCGVRGCGCVHMYGCTVWMCARVSVCVCTGAHMCVSVCICMGAQRGCVHMWCVWVYIYVCMCAHCGRVWVCVRTCVYVHACVQHSAHVCGCVHMCDVGVCTCMCGARVCVHVYTHGGVRVWGYMRMFLCVGVCVCAHVWKAVVVQEGDSVRAVEGAAAHLADRPRPRPALVWPRPQGLEEQHSPETEPGTCHRPLPLSRAL